MSYIVDFNPIIKDNNDYEYLARLETKIKNKESLSSEEINFFLDTVCYLARFKVNENMDNFDYKCDLFQALLAYYFQGLNCEIKPCMTQNVITNDIVGHSFLIVKFLVDDKEQYYLLDPSYIQFFKKERCQSSNYFLNNKFPYQILLTPDPGYFIQKDKKQLAEFLLNHGYIILNEETAKMYGDSFFNTKLMVSSENLKFQSIPGSVYINSFLKGKENLSKLEEELNQFDYLLTPFCELSEIKIKQ